MGVGPCPHPPSMSCLGGDKITWLFWIWSVYHISQLSPDSLVLMLSSQIIVWCLDLHYFLHVQSIFFQIIVAQFLIGKFDDSAYFQHPNFLHLDWKKVPKWERAATIVFKDTIKGMLHPCGVEEAVTRGLGLQYHGIWYQEKVTLKNKILIQNANYGIEWKTTREGGKNGLHLIPQGHMTHAERKYCMNFDLKSNHHFMGHESWQGDMTNESLQRLLGWIGIDSYINHRWSHHMD